MDASRSSASLTPTVNLPYPKAVTEFSRATISWPSTASPPPAPLWHKSGPCSPARPVKSVFSLLSAPAGNSRSSPRCNTFWVCSRKIRLRSGPEKRNEISRSSGLLPEHFLLQRRRRDRVQTLADQHGVAPLLDHDDPL